MIRKSLVRFLVPACSLALLGVAAIAYSALTA